MQRGVDQSLTTRSSSPFQRGSLASHSFGVNYNLCTLRGSAQTTKRPKHVARPEKSAVAKLERAPLVNELSTRDRAAMCQAGLLLAGFPPTERELLNEQENTGTRFQTRLIVHQSREWLLCFDNKHRTGIIRRALIDWQ